MTDDGSAGERRPSFAAFRERLEALGFRPSRRFGQNFLLDPTLHRAITVAASIEPRDVVLEIGVGLGFLTRELVTAASHVVAVEIDSRLASIVAEDHVDWPHGDRLELIEADALGRGGQLSAPVQTAIERAVAGERRLAAVANLPYAVSGPLLAALVTDPRPPTTIVALVQYELGERVAAGHPGIGGLSVLLQRFYRVELLRRVGREVFRPRPNVDSAVIRLTARDPVSGWPPADTRSRFAAWLRSLFAARRKTMSNAVRGAVKATGLAQPATLGSDEARARAEQIEPDRHWQLFVDAADL